ncbi:hypothetical protein SAMN06265348_104441 [Pedobacter westerhofensis]|uniref:Right handed beta helix region n=1 Tax=Pedobacter westerhofensis TaxID=425512 RepID=A0A521D2P5_9SPHI|nr:hypothetical protein [Pedobacter westerhofensis]SMO65963.1 hypothetical protein SAMN06265348_104441 [Pedobacter westerhofensis]
MKKIFLAVVVVFILNSCAKQNDIKSLSEEKSKTTAMSSVLALNSYYVNGTSGSDSNDGTSAATALKTIQAALWKTADSAGTTIYVAGGTYKERLYWPHSGASAAEPLTLTNYNGETVTLDGVDATNSAQNEMIGIASRSHIRINHINIANNIRKDAKGIYMVGAGTDVQFTNCKIYNIGWTDNASAQPSSTDNANPMVVVGSFGASYSNIYIGYNEVYSCNTGFSEGMTLTGNVENFLIEGNIVHDIRNIGIDISGHYSWANPTPSVNFARNGNVKYNTVYRCVSPIAVSAGIYVDGGKWVNVEGNTSYENSTGISAGCENSNNTAEGINIRSNFIYNNVEAGIIMGSNAAGSKVVNSKIINNSLFKNFSKTGWGGEIHLQNVDQLSVVNNIIQSASNIVVVASLGYSATNLSFDYNNYYSASGTAATITFDWGGINGNTYGSFAAYKAGTGLDANSTYSVPSFISAALPVPNLHLTSASSCINAGLPSFTAQPGELDIDKEARVRNGRVDIGADESAY